MAAEIDYTREVTDVKEALLTEIEATQKKLKMLEHIDDYMHKGITYDEYKTLCLTDMRHTKTLSKLIEVSLPFLKLTYQGSNGMEFTIKDVDDVKVYIPYNTEGVNLMVESYCEAEGVTTRKLQSEVKQTDTENKQKIAECETYLSTRKYSEKVQIAVPNLYKESKTMACVLYPVLNVFKHYDRHFSEDMTKYETQQKQMTKETKQKLSKSMEQYNAQQKLFAKYAKQFLNWTDKVYIREFKGNMHSREIKQVFYKTKSGNIQTEYLNV